MGAQLQLVGEGLAVEPGKSLTTSVTVRNNGTVVDRFTFEALGPAAEWVTFEPDSLNLFPEASGSVNVIVAPPRLSTVPAGDMPFGVRAVSTEDPDGSSAEEATLQVGAFSDMAVELLPRVVTARRSGPTRLAVDNRSNIPYDAEVSGGDSAAALQFTFRPKLVSVPPGGVEFVKIRIRPKPTFWRGPSRTKPFSLALVTDKAPHPPRLQADGSLLQEALLPKWLIWLIGGLVALAALFAILWFTLFKPQIKSAATDEVNKQLAAAGITPTQSASSSPTKSAGSGSGSGASSTSPTSTGNSSTVAPGSGGSGSLTVNGASVANGNGTQVVFTVPSAHTLQVTDLLIQNAAGDNGTLTLSRNGTTLMQWSMADFRDLDYHWVSPTVFNAGEAVVMEVSGCTNVCHPGLYYAGDLVKTS